MININNLDIPDFLEILDYEKILSDIAFLFCMLFLHESGALFYMKGGVFEKK